MQGRRETERFVYLSTGLLPIWLPPAWTGPGGPQEAGAPSVNDRGPSTYIVFHCFPMCVSIEGGAAGFGLTPRGCWCCRLRLNCCTTVPTQDLDV